MSWSRYRADERRAMWTFAQAHGIAFDAQPSRFMPGRMMFIVGEGKARRIANSAQRAWDLLRRAARPAPPARKPSATLRGAVLGIRVVK